MLIGRDRRVARLTGGDRLAPVPQLVTGAAALAALEASGLSSVLLRSGGGAALGALAAAGVSQVALAAASASPVQFEELLGNGHSAVALLGSGGGEFAALAGQGIATVTRAGLIGAWYRFDASTPVSGEWETVVDMLGGSPLIQTDADRKLAVSASANGLPTGTYDGTDCMRMPLGANNFSTSKFGLSRWLRVSASGNQTILGIFNNDAAVRVLQLAVNAALGLFLNLWIGTNVDGRTYTTAAGVITAAAWRYVRLQLDMTKTNECDTTGTDEDAKVRLFVGETGLPLTPSNIGAGGALTTLRTPTGAAIWGGLNDSDTPSSPMANGSVHGPNTFIWLQTPPATLAQNVMNFEVPT